MSGLFLEKEKNRNGKCSTCGSLLNAVDTAFSASAMLAQLVKKCSTFSKINNMT
jgi:hypothetical protein